MLIASTVHGVGTSFIDGVGTYIVHKINVNLQPVTDQHAVFIIDLLGLSSYYNKERRVATCVYALLIVTQLVR